jgi:hypothetical protein
MSARFHRKRICLKVSFLYGTDRKAALAGCKRGESRNSIFTQRSVKQW